jgi:membrane protease YdiL (CAAX protease family)
VGVVTGRLVAWASFIAFFSATSYANNFLVEGDSDAEPLYHWAFFVSGLVGFAIMIGVALLIAIALPKRDVFALRSPSSWGRAIGIGIGILVAVFALSAVIGLFLDPGGEQGLLPDRWPPPDWLVFGLNAATVVIGAPIAEEILFRGLGYTLLERFAPGLAIGGSAVAWALAHGLVQAFPLIFALGVGLGFLRRRTGTIVPGMLLHATFNGIALISAAVAAGN